MRKLPNLDSARHLTGRATALHFHGGNFTVGSKQLLSRDQSERLLDLGFVVVSANYRLAPTVTVFEGAVKDALDAYEWSRTKLPGLLLEDAYIKADGSRIVTLGHSCGGTLALLTVRRYRELSCVYVADTRRSRPVRSHRLAQS